MSDAADDVGRLAHRQDLRTGRGVLGAHMRGWVGERRRRYATTANRLADGDTSTPIIKR